MGPVTSLILAAIVAFLALVLVMLAFASPEIERLRRDNRALRRDRAVQENVIEDLRNRHKLLMDAHQRIIVDMERGNHR